MIRTIRSFFGLIRIGFVFAREGLLTRLVPKTAPLPLHILVWFASWIERSGASKSKRATQLTRAMQRLGPSYVKMGQFLASRPDLVGKTLAADLSSLQDQAEPFDQKDAVKTLKQELGAPVHELYAKFGTSVAAASIAQVHKATLTIDDEEREVAVKILRPDIEARFARDLETFYFVARLAEYFVPSARRLRPVASVDVLARSAELEMDLRMEAAALSEMADLFANEPRYRLPKIYWEYSSRRVLTLEWIDGTKVSDLETLTEEGHDLDRLGEIVIETFLKQALNHGFFHADMHPGNLFIDKESNLVALDFGIMGRIGRMEQRFLAEILYGFIERDYMRIAEVHFEAGYVPARHRVADFAQALRGIGEPIHGRPADQISMAGLLTQLFEVTELFDMETRTELILLQKTMVVAEGVARILNPNLNMWTASEPVVRAWMERQLGPTARLEQASESLNALARMVNDLPKLSEQARDLTATLERLNALSAKPSTTRVSYKGFFWLTALALTGVVAVLIL